MPVDVTLCPDPARRDSLALARFVLRRVYQLVRPVLARRRRQRVPDWHRDFTALAAPRTCLAVLARSLGRFARFERPSLHGHGVASTWISLIPHNARNSCSGQMIPRYAFHAGRHATATIAWRRRL